MDRSKTKTYQGILKILHLHVWYKRTPFSFVNYSILLSVCLVPDMDYNYPWQLSHDSDISNILGCPRQSRFQFYIFTLWLCSRHPLKALLDSYLASEPSLNPGRRFLSVLYPWLESQNHWFEAAMFGCLARLELGLLVPLYLHHLSVVYDFLSLFKVFVNSSWHAGSLAVIVLPWFYYFLYSIFSLGFSLNILSPWA